MTEDYIAISNTGKNITITMTPGMKQRIMQDYGRIRLVYSSGHACFGPTLHPIGRKIIKRKNVWNVSMASARCPDWPIHERAVYRMAQIEFQGGAARVTLPKPAVDMDSMLRSLTADFRRDIPLPKPAQDDFDSKTIAEFQRSGFRLGRPPQAIRNDHPEMDKPVPSRDEPAKRAEYINLSGEYFDVLVNEEDQPRFWKAYLRTLEKTEARHLFIVPDMVVAAITGACGGFIIALMLAAAGVLK